MNFHSIAKHLVGYSLGLAAVVCQPATAQTATLTNGGVATGAISCAPSNNGTAHMVCLEYTTSGSLTGVSWQAPPQGLHVPADRPTHPAEATDTIDTEPLPAPGGTPVGLPGCASENFNDSGAIICLVVSKATSGSFLLQGITFYPPTDHAGTTAPTAYLSLGTEPPNTVMGNPSCSSAGSGGAIVCAIAINGHLFGVGLNPRSNISTALTALLTGATVTGNPSCASGANGNAIPSVCAVREGNTLVGFALAFTPPPAAAVASEDAISLGAMTFAGDPGCAIPANGQVAATSFVATCGIVSGTTLFGLSFDPIDVIPASAPASHTTAFQSLGKAADTGNWAGGVSCSNIADFRLGAPTPANQFPNASPNQNLVGCAALSSAANVFEVTFDPRVPVTRSVIGPFGGSANATLSCLSLNIARENIYCGGTTAAGASVGYTVLVGILPPGTQPVLGLVSD